MKHWVEKKEEESISGKKIILAHKDGDRVVSVFLNLNNDVTFREECDGYFVVHMGKEEAMAALKEAIAWIENS